MIPPVPAEGAAPGGQQQQRQGSGVAGTIIRVMVVWWIARQVMSLGSGGGKAPAPGAEEGYRSAIKPGDPLSMRAYLSEQDVLDLENLSTGPVWRLPDFTMPLAAEAQQTIIYRPSKAVQNNGSLYLHTLFEALATQTDENGAEVQRPLKWTRTWPVIEYMPRPKNKTGINLLSKKNDAGEESTHKAEKELAAKPQDIIAWMKPNITISIVDDYTVLNPMALLPQQKAWVHFDTDTTTYMPTVFFNDFWTLPDHMVPVNSSLSEVELHLSLNAIKNWKFLMYLQIEQSFSMQVIYMKKCNCRPAAINSSCKKTMGAMVDGETDELKRVLLEGNPLFLALTFAVSMLHSVFDMLAFKNDIGFWKDKKSVEGLSVKTIFINCFCQAIVLLYLIDNDTSWVILASSFVGLLIEFWKITKAMDVTIDRSGPIPRIHFKNKDSYNQSRTKQYDDEAMRYLSYVLYPLVFGYGVYSLIYNPHKSWYSWIVNSLVGAVYAFGFILMCPQLYLNYKLKSVAHLPWRQMTYKFLNTIVDDLFAFVIKMPMLHRLSVFRDDLVFLVFIYQKWIYRTDFSRANEFGWSGEAEKEGGQQQVGDGGTTPQLEGADGTAPDAEPEAAEPAGTSDISDFEDLGASEDIPEASEDENRTLRQRRGAAAAAAK